ncbi:hypothetical protein Scep_027355 [Stephania cephalantha]|uniref:TOD1/MUCI70 glycosyltransferase-like domain-containing protein n=1 Tax=Stephania cephalantha TaxID=152367 RepID=A0AAP0HH67_9MAGN
MGSKPALSLKTTTTTTTSPPLFLKSKLLCFSLLYLSTTLFLSLYASISSKCFFSFFITPSPLDPISYHPSNYGEHKYAIPTLRSSCTSPVRFADYWLVVKEIKDSLRNYAVSEKGFRYLERSDGSFGGKFSAHERFSYFDHGENQRLVMEIPCGFMKEFHVSEYDRIAMEKCREIVVVSAIFGDHDKIRQPRGLGSKTLETVCFFIFVDDHTFESLKSHNLVTDKAHQVEHKVGLWRVVRVLGELPYENPAMNGVIPKHLVHRLFPNSRFSVWTDAKIQLTVDPLLLIHSLVVLEDMDMAISKHPYYIHTMEEAMATARWKKWEDVGSLKMQMETYCENGLRPWTPQKLPYPSDVPDTALILRKHGVASNLFSCLLFNELEAFNPRDQLAFAFIRDQMKPKMKLNMFDAEVFEQIAVEYRHNIKQGKKNITAQKGSKTKRRPSSSNLSANGTKWTHSGCLSYLQEMWGEAHD